VADEAEGEDGASRSAAPVENSDGLGVEPGPNWIWRLLRWIGRVILIVLRSVGHVVAWPFVKLWRLTALLVATVAPQWELVTAEILVATVPIWLPAFGGWSRICSAVDVGDWVLTEEVILLLAIILLLRTAQMTGTIPRPNGGILVAALFGVVVGAVTFQNIIDRKDSPTVSAVISGIMLAFALAISIAAAVVGHRAFSPLHLAVPNESQAIGSTDS